LLLNGRRIEIELKSLDDEGNPFVYDLYGLASGNGISVVVENKFDCVQEELKRTQN